MDHASKNNLKLTLAAFFVLLLLSGFVFSMIHIQDIAVAGGRLLWGALHRTRSFSEVPAAFEEEYNALFAAQPWSLDAFSFTQRALGKHETRNFEVLKANDGALYLHGNEEDVDEETLRRRTEEYQVLFEETNRYGGHFLYVQVPYKNVGQAPELAAYSGDNTEEYESRLDTLLRDSGIPVLDLRAYDTCKDYYATDHHWTTISAFYAAKIIADEVERLYNIDLTDHTFFGDMENYESITYEDCFLGSIGVKVGPYYAGKDSFTVLNPQFPTDFTFEHYIDSVLQSTYSGPFVEAFIDQSLLENRSYNNKYEANMHGAYVESIIKNHLAQNDLKGLLVTHSYGRAMAPYLSLDFGELRYLDPQKGRFNDDLTVYIREYKPDVVIFMYNWPVNIGDGQWEG